MSQAETGNSLETFDFLELLAMLARGGKTGALRVERDQQILTLWLSAGRVRHMDGAGLATDAAALAGLLKDPRGRFRFEEGEAAPPPTLDLSYDAFAYEAFKLLPPPPLKFPGAGRLESPERLAELSLNLYEQEVLRGVAEGKPLSDLAAARDPQAAALLGRLVRLRLIGERRTRVARLLVQVSRRGGAAAVMDESIYRRWREAVGSRIEQIQVREERSGKVHLLPVISGSQVGTVLELPPELLIRTGLRGGDAVLVRPV
ncbi:DUF4388 domain-containing protein [Deinococcus rubellus]|uniref:DUF4388 domain-containing protein n=1 Tax=Deinococcus rubellus TaxID=1889240 RepID=A0ABY5YKL3_9DEIO|nr:DUF4388 domain-containing protein [Deinococcus rubellus]UWX65471.1 DUF4388 domain-containing protein [Deinococcus rubellus]